jgi:hypothetical protein
MIRVMSITKKKIAIAIGTMRNTTLTALGSGRTAMVIMLPGMWETTGAFTILKSITMKKLAPIILITKLMLQTNNQEASMIALVTLEPFIMRATATIMKTTRLLMELQPRFMKIVGAMKTTLTALVSIPRVGLIATTMLSMKILLANSMFTSGTETPITNIPMLMKMAMKYGRPNTMITLWKSLGLMTAPQILGLLISTTLTTFSL